MKQRSPYPDRTRDKQRESLLIFWLLLSRSTTIRPVRSTMGRKKRKTFVSKDVPDLQEADDDEALDLLRGMQENQDESIILPEKILQKFSIVPRINLVRLPDHLLTQHYVKSAGGCSSPPKSNSHIDLNEHPTFTVIFEEEVEEDSRPEASLIRAEIEQYLQKIADLTQEMRQIGEDHKQTLLKYRQEQEKAIEQQLKESFLEETEKLQTDLTRTYLAELEKVKNNIWCFNKFCLQNAIPGFTCGCHFHYYCSQKCFDADLANRENCKSSRKANQLPDETPNL